jgi:hypothetical protein
MRKFLTLDGEVLDEMDWNVSPKDNCFYCGDKLDGTPSLECWESLDGNHDWITLVNPSNRR